MISIEYILLTQKGHVQYHLDQLTTVSWSDLRSSKSNRDRESFSRPTMLEFLVHGLVTFQHESVLIRPNTQAGRKNGASLKQD